MASYRHCQRSGEAARLSRRSHGLSCTSSNFPIKKRTNFWRSALLVEMAGRRPLSPPPPVLTDLAARTVDAGGWASNSLCDCMWTNRSVMKGYRKKKSLSAGKRKLFELILNEGGIDLPRRPVIPKTHSAKACLVTSAQ